MIEKRLLQAAIVLACLVPLAAGGAGETVLPGAPPCAAASARRFG